MYQCSVHSGYVSVTPDLYWAHVEACAVYFMQDLDMNWSFQQACERLDTWSRSIGSFDNRQVYFDALARYAELTKEI